MNWFKYAAPQRFYPLAGILVTWCSVLAFHPCTCLLDVYGDFCGHGFLVCNWSRF